jgi:hypothetical protein
MKQFTKQLNTKAKAVTLQSVEERELRARVVSFMEYHPLPVSKKVSVTALRGQEFKMISLPFPLFSRWTAAFAVFIVLLIPFLAEQTVPGDNLYAVKVRFNEEVRGTLALSPYQKVEWETERLNRRIAEVRLLASEGRLTESVEAEIAGAVLVHTANIKKEIEVLRADDADQATLASIELTTTLQVQSGALMDSEEAAFVSDTAGQGGSTGLLVSAINQSLTEQEPMMANVTLPAYDKIMARVEMNTTRAYELLESLRLDESNPSYADVSRRLSDINRGIEKANGLRSESEETAQVSLIDALQRTQKLIVFMSELRATLAVDIENIVPIVLTPEEEVTTIVRFNEEISEKVALITYLLPQVPSSVLGKVEATVLQSTSNLIAIASSTEFTEKKTIAVETITVLNDTLALMEGAGVTVTNIEVPKTEIPVEEKATEEDTATSTESQLEV